MIDRTAGEGRYARVEREQRWLLARLPDHRDRPLAISDLYLEGTRLRLRRMGHGEQVVYKLAQKVRPEPDDPAVVKLTNIYLSEAEHAVLARLPGAEITKTRWRWETDGRTLMVDEFSGPLAGLVLAEVELGPAEPKLRDPPFTRAEVTDDDRFSGGTLATTTAAQLRLLLAELGGPADR